jgi:hypothetical protein
MQKRVKCILHLWWMEQKKGLSFFHFVFFFAGLELTKHEISFNRYIEIRFVTNFFCKNKCDQVDKSSE